MFNEIFGALAANVGTSLSDGGLSSNAVLFFARLLITGFTGGLFCGTGTGALLLGDVNDP